MPTWSNVSIILIQKIPKLSNTVLRLRISLHLKKNMESHGGPWSDTCEHLHIRAHNAPVNPLGTNVVPLNRRRSTCETLAVQQTVYSYDFICLFHMSIHCIVWCKYALKLGTMQRIVTQQTAANRLRPLFVVQSEEVGAIWVIEKLCLASSNSALCRKQQ